MNTAKTEQSTDNSEITILKKIKDMRPSNKLLAALLNKLKTLSLLFILTQMLKGASTKTETISLERFKV